MDLNRNNPSNNKNDNDRQGRRPKSHILLAIIMILLGRMISLFDRLFGEKVSALAGLKGIHP